MSKILIVEDEAKIARFVTLELDGSTVTAMTGNQEALDAYKASLPEPVEPPPTTEEILNAMLGVSE